MVQLFAKGLVAILVVLSGDIITASLGKTRDVLLEGDRVGVGVGYILWNTRALFFLAVAVALLILLWNSDKLRRLVRYRKAEIDDLLNHMTDGFIKLDHNFRYTSVNKKAGEMVRMNPASMIGKNIWDLFPDLKSSPTYNAFTDAMKTRQTLRVMDYYPPLDLWYENNIYPTTNGISVFIKDVTDRMHAEQRLLESARLYKTIASTIPGSAICIVDKSYNHVLVEGELKKELSVICKKRDEEMKPYLDKAFGGQSFSVETTWNEYDLLTRYVPLYDEHNEIFSIMIVAVDVTPLKEAERRVSESNVILEQKIAERTAELELVNKDLESFSYSVAHDLRAPLRAVEGYTQMLIEDYSSKADEEANRLMSFVKNNAIRMGTLIDDLLAFSKLGRKEINKSVVNMKSLVENALQQVPVNKAAVELREINPVYGDITLLQYVLLNLLSNAIKYSSKKEKPKVIITSAVHDKIVTYSICDNGVGFDMKYANKLFGVFQRLHKVEDFEGTGVGLAIVQKIIHRHGGKVWAHAKPQEGATFFFTLPAVPSERV